MVKASPRRKLDPGRAPSRSTSVIAPDGAAGSDARRATRNADAALRVITL
jgi:hypothetical protein